MTVALSSSNFPHKNNTMWYAASLYFESVLAPPESGESVWEHRVILVEAMDDATASQFASDYGKKAEHSYLNQAGASVTWRFDSVDSVDPIEANEFASGLEIYSRFLTSSEEASLKQPFDD